MSNIIEKARALLQAGTDDSLEELLALVPALLDHAEQLERDAEEWIDLPRLQLGRSSDAKP